MSQRARQRAILRIVHERPISSQGQLVEELARRGYRATQATVSRDIRRLGLLKLADEGGGARYVAVEDLDDAKPRAATDSLRAAFEQFVLGVGPVQALLLVETRPGRANAVAVAIDEARLAGIAGTLAGDDTILVLLRRAQDRAAVLRAFRSLLED
jgi:transcriptional regulator of arginine metabolism